LKAKVDRSGAERNFKDQILPLYVKAIQLAQVGTDCKIDELIQISRILNDESVTTEIVNTMK